MRVAAGGGYGREQVEARETSCSARSAQVGARAFQVFVGRKRVFDEAVQLRVVEQGPELRLDFRAVEAGLPDVDELRRHRRDRLLIIGPNRTGTQCRRDCSDEAAREELM